jgi:hypothetical protein
MYLLTLEICINTPQTYILDVWPLYNSEVYILILNFIFDIIGFILAIFHKIIYDP